jgi:hypothetical protein
VHIKNPVRPWRVIAEELSQEVDSEKISRLAFELAQALDEQEMPKLVAQTRERDSAA